MEGIIMKQYKIFFASILATVLFTTPFIYSSNADSLPTHSQLKASLKAVVAEENGGFGFNMWATIVDRDGVVMLSVFQNLHYQLQISSQRFSQEAACLVCNLAIPLIPK
jgi:Gpi18-like mannosyltransferase